MTSQRLLYIIVRKRSVVSFNAKANPKFQKINVISSNNNNNIDYTISKQNINLPGFYISRIVIRLKHKRSLISDTVKFVTKQN